METTLFVLEEGTKNWRYKNFVVLEVKDDRWKMYYDDGFHKHESDYESMYYVIDELSKNFNILPVFKIPEDLTPSSGCT